MRLERQHESEHFVVTVAVTSKTVGGHGFMTDQQYEITQRLQQVALNEEYLVTQAFETVPRKG